MANQEAISEIKKIIDEENIKCDFEIKPAYVFTEDTNNIEKIQKEVKTVNSIGGEAKFVENIEPPLENVKRRYRISKSSTIQSKKIFKRIN